MKFIPDLSYCLVEEVDLMNHSRFLSIEKRYANRSSYKKFKNLLDTGSRIPKPMWPLIPQRTKAWLDIRKTGFLTGSTVASFIGFKLPKYRKLLGLSNYYDEVSNIDSYRRIQLGSDYERPKFGLTQRVFMAWGDHEANAIYSLLDKYPGITIEEWGFSSFDNKNLPKSVIEKPYVKEWFPDIGVSPDGIINGLWGEKWLLEVKSPTPFFPNNKSPLDGFFFKVHNPKIKTIYIPQMLMQSLVWGIKNVLHVIYTVHFVYVYKFIVTEEALALFIKVICKCHKQFATGKVQSGLNNDIHEFIDYCNETVVKMKKTEVKFTSVNNLLKKKKYIYNKHMRNYMKKRREKHMK